MKCAHDKSGSKDNKMCRSVTGMSLRATGRGVKSRVTSTAFHQTFEMLDVSDGQLGSPNGHVLHGVWERRERRREGGLFSIPSCGGLWTCVCVFRKREGRES